MQRSGVVKNKWALSTGVKNIDLARHASCTSLFGINYASLPASALSCVMYVRCNLFGVTKFHHVGTHVSITSSSGMIEMVCIGRMVSCVPT